ncbi:Spy/CpxP family protein refolding chaperone [Acidicapsa ligni]|uniref:Spy/CpxP family protein refolding chaperone n=1 Tax=Acidicapsa ligni TaxID=542300 RepID=UPI0021E0DB98|nr:Spy/CpxP family protein refolding chaperone [Acidicapsa ligni]
MTKKTMTCGLAIAALWVAGAATGLAQGPDGMPGMGPHHPPMERAMGHGGDHGRWWNEPRAIEKLKLTDAQRKSMDDIYQQHRLKLVDLHATLEKEELMMEPLIRADQPDEAKVLAEIDKIAQARAELEKANARMLLGLRRQLTPEQWKQLEAERTARHERRDQDGDGRREWRRPGGQSGGPGAGQPGSQGGPDGNKPGAGPGESGLGSGPAPSPGLDSGSGME